MTRHLSEEELDSLLQASADSEVGTGGVAPPAPEAVRNHLAACKKCERKLDMHKTLQNVLRDARSAKFEKLPGQCAEEEKWAKVAAGIQSEQESVRLLEHAAKCDRCGALLQEAMANVREGTTEEEEALLAGMQSQRREWAEALAPKLKHAAGQDEKPTRGRRWWQMWFKPPALVFASVLLLAAIGWEVAQFKMGTPIAGGGKPSASSQESGKGSASSMPEKPVNGSPAPGTLMAMAYRDYRTMEYRIPGAPFAQMHPVERGVPTSVADLPSSVLDATRAVHEGLEGNPTDPRLLDARAQLDLLDGNPGKAIEYLEKARQKDVESPVILTDLATAYLLSAEQSNSHMKNGVALNLLGEVLKKSPNDPVVLYNYALALEKLQLYGQAVQTWNMFLDHETDQNWKKDGLAHRDFLIQHGLTEDRFKNPAKHEPHAALQDLLSRPKGSVESEMDVLNDELYLSDALTDWLPAVLATATAERSRDGPAALAALAKVLRERHHDLLLAELAEAPHGPALARAATELAAALQANARGEIDEVAPHAQNAIALFREVGSRAGEAAATFQWLSGLNQAEMADRCRAVAGAALKLPDLHRYPWVETNLLFEAATCDLMIGRQEEMLAYSRRAVRVAEQSRYKVLALWGAYFQDGVTIPWVATHDAWNRVGAGLDEFWRHPYPPDVGAGFYSDLGYAAEEQGLWYCAEEIYRESVRIHSSYGDSRVEAGARQNLARAAEAAGDEQTAEAEYSEAAELYARLGPSGEASQLENMIARAAMEVRRNHLPEAEAALKEIAPRLGRVSNHYSLIPYLAAAGELHLRNGDPRLAEQELLKAIHLIEQDKSSLQSDTDLLTWHRDASQAYRSLMRLYFDEYRQDERAFSLLEWYRAAPLRRAAGRNGSQEPEDVAMTRYFPGRAPTGPTSGVLTWIAFETHLVIFLLDQHGLHTARVPVSRDDLDLEMQRLTRLCADPQSDMNALNHEARQIHAWLVEPLATYLEPLETLIIEPDEGMEGIPFQVLRTSKGEYLGSRLAIVESPGMGYMQILRADKRITPGSVMLAVGDPQQGGDARLVSLPDASREATAIAASFDHHFLFTGRQAVLANVTQRLAQAEVFHFAGHAISDGNQTGLVLAKETRSTGMILLDQEKLSRENLRRLKLVVLSGCETGIADAGLIDPGNLVRVFLRAAVPNVVASKWKVDSYMSARLLEDVYRGLLRGEPIEKALADAQKPLQSAGLHPYYWAAFSVFGR
jgi:CHAT domain-containing protein